MLRDSKGFQDFLMRCFNLKNPVKDSSRGSPLGAAKLHSGEVLGGALASPREKNPKSL